MREILFRGKRKDTGEWVYGGLRQIWEAPGEGERYAICPGKRYCEDGFTDMDEAEVSTETIGQFTGLQDKNGVKIFEGDIIMQNTSIMGIVRWEPRFRIDPILPDKTVISAGIPKEIRHSWCVVGNIHDKPELLEVQE